MASSSTPSASLGNGLGSIEWERAHGVHISADLVSAAKKELAFLAVVHNTSALRKTRILRRAVERYLNCWLPLICNWEDTNSPLLPPLDCAWIWHCHMLNPVQYGKDCQELFGKLVDMRSDEGSDSDLPSEVEQATIRLWEDLYPDEPFAFVQKGADHAIRTYAERELSIISSGSSPKVLAFNLVTAAKRQNSFYYQVCQPWMADTQYLQAALERYKGFLHLMKRSLESSAAAGVGRIPFLVPTYDIDLLWHSHQLFPTAYRADTLKCMGKILDHDDSDSDRSAGQRLHNSFLETCVAWEDTFGMVYERAGAVYRGPEPTPVPPIPVEDPNQVVTGYPATAVTPLASDPELHMEESGNVGLTRRKTMQVHLVLLGARNIPQKPGRKTSCYVRVTALKKCPGMSLTTSPTECSSLENSSDNVTVVEGQWNQGFSMEAEVSTMGLKLELMKYTKYTTDGAGNKGLMGRMKRTIQSLTSSAKCLGEVLVHWRTDLLDSSGGLSFSKVSTVARQSPEKIKGRGSNGTLFPDPELHFSVSVTPPSSAPYIFRMLAAPVTDDTGLQVARRLPYPEEKRQEGRWVTRVVSDHSGEEQFVVRTRFASGVLSMFESPRRTKGDQKVIHIHQGTVSRKREWQYQGQFLVRTHGPVVGFARQLPIAVEQGHSSRHRHWSLFNDAAVLIVNKPEFPSSMLDCHIQGNLGYPFRLLPGRCLEYETRSGPEGGSTTSSEDHKFLTFVRYTPESRHGKATALINWQSGFIEVQSEESVVLILLIASAINSSLVDMRHHAFQRVSTFHGLPLSVQSKIARGHRNPDYDGDLGAMLIERNGLSSMWTGPTSEDHSQDGNIVNNLLFHTRWWNLSDKEILSAEFGGTQCGSGACGGGACGGGGCSSGVAGTFYFQSPET